MTEKLAHRRAKAATGKEKMKLGELLGAELYAQVKARIDEVNGNEPDQLKHVRYADLSEGGYVSKAKYEALKAEHGGQAAELQSANELIAQLKKSAKGDEGLQERIAGYEGQVAGLQAELEKTKLQSAIKVALLSEKAADVDYLAFKLNEAAKEKGEALELDENGSIKGWEARLEGLKTQFPKMFENAAGEGGEYRPLNTGGLPKGEQDADEDPKSLEEALKMKYEQND